MKKFSFTLYAAACILFVNGQTIPKSNTVYFELGGNALFTSLNYERQLLKNTRLNFHIGTGIYGMNPAYLTIPFGVNYLFKSNYPTSYIDLGVGATYSKADVKLYEIVDNKNPNYKNTNYWNGVLSIGYRKLTKRNLMYRISFTPVINHNDFFPFFGFSIGKSF